MKDRFVRPHILPVLTSRFAAIVVFAGLLSAIPVPAVLAQSVPDLGTAATFAVLGGTAVTCTDSVVVGDVGVDLNGAITQTNCTIVGTVHAAAEEAYDDFLVAYDALGAAPCDVTLTGPLAGLSLTPGVYCFDAASTDTGGVLTLVGSASDTWIFKIGTLGTGALTATNFSVVMSGGETCSNNVFWWTAEAATLTDSVFVGNILAGTSITVTRGSLDGQALAKAAVTLTNTEVSACATAPARPGIKVTGGGQIAVPDPQSAGRASFGFNAQPDKKSGTAKGHFNYVNHVTGLHVNGQVTSIQVIATNADGSPRTVRFAGTCKGDSPACSFSVTVEDHGEPGRSDQFGIRVSGGATEVRSQRVIARGNIQFHK
jgi:hypothetical protein